MTSSVATCRLATTDIDRNMLGEDNTESTDTDILQLK